jgi:hypothetical protein
VQGGEARTAGVVESFVEKPTGDRLEMLAHASKHATPEFPFEASMGIYVFKCARAYFQLHMSSFSARRNAVHAAMVDSAPV